MPIPSGENIMINNIKEIPISKFKIGEQVIAKGLWFYNIFIVKSAWYKEIQSEWEYTIGSKGFWSIKYARLENESKSIIQ